MRFRHAAVFVALLSVSSVMAMETDTSEEPLQCGIPSFYDSSCFTFLDNNPQGQLVFIDKKYEDYAVSAGALYIEPQFLHTKSYLRGKKVLVAADGFQRSQEQRWCQQWRASGMDVRFIVEGAEALLLGRQLKDYEPESRLLSSRVLVNELLNSEPQVILVDQPVPESIDSLSFGTLSLSSRSPDFWSELAQLQNLYAESGRKPIVLIDPHKHYSETLLKRLGDSPLRNIFLLDGQVESVMAQLQNNQLAELSKAQNLSVKRCL